MKSIGIGEFIAGNTSRLRESPAVAISGSSLYPIAHIVTFASQLLNQRRERETVWVVKGVMPSKAERYRRKAEECLEQAELFPDEATKSRMKALADEWLKLAAQAASEKG
jgi:hypothetical protein